MLGQFELGDFTINFEAHQTLSGTIYLMDSIMPGDPSGDEVVNIVDILLMINVILGQTTFYPEQLYAADLNQDENINILDVIIVVNIILGNS